MLRPAAAKREPHVATMIKASIKNTAVSKFVRNEQQLEEIVLRMKQASERRPASTVTPSHH